MDTVNKALWYLFVMGVILVLVAYWIGSTNLLSTVFSGGNTLLRTSTGQGANGFNAYPTTG